MNKKSLINSLPAIAKMLGNKMQVKVRISGDTAYTDGETINIPMLPDGPKALILARGFIDHEAAHVRFTDFSAKRNNELEAILANVLEDVRIERLIGETFPGCKTNLIELTELLASQGDFSLPEEGLIQPSQAFITWLLAGLRFSVLNQTALGPVADNAMEILHEIFPNSVIDELMDLAIEGSMAESTRDALDTSRKIIKVLESWEEEQRKQEQQQQSSPDQDQQDDQDSNDSDQGDQQASPDQSNDKNSNQKKDDSSQDNDSDDSKLDSDNTSEGQGDSSSDKDDSSSDQGGASGEKEDQNSTESAKGRLSGGSSAADMVKQILTASEADMQNTDLGDLVRGALDEISDDSTDDNAITLSTEKRAEPCGCMDISTVRKTTASLRGRLAGLIQSARYQPCYTGKSGNRIASNALSRLATMDQRVFKRSDNKQVINTAVVVLLDRSSSMRGSEMKIASQATLAATMALDTIPGVSVASAAFPGTTDCEVCVMTNFGESVRSTTKFYSVTASGYTPTNEALDWAGIKLSIQPEPRKICLVITDGQPNNSHSAQCAAERMRQSGIEVLGIGIRCNEIKHFIPNSQIINSVSDLPQALFGVLQKQLTS